MFSRRFDNNLLTIRGSFHYLKMSLKRSYSNYTGNVVSRSSSAGPYQRQRSGGKMPVRAKRSEKQALTAAKVRKIVVGLAEKKVVQYSATLDLSAYNGTNWNNNGILGVSPQATWCQIDQGVSQDQRIGNKVRPYSCTLDLMMCANQINGTYNPNPAPNMVRIVTFSIKESNDVPTSLPNFFQDGSSSHAPLSNGSDMVLPINRDVYTVYGDTSVKLGNAQWSVAGSTAASGNFANNDYSLNPMLSMDLTKHLPSVVTYNDNLSEPTSRAVFVTFFCVRADGRLSDAAYIPGIMYTSLKIKYTDE